MTLPGPGGIGKTTAMKHLARSWAAGSSEDLKQFSFVFYISLTGVTDDTSLEEIIMDQHSGLEESDVQDIKAILKSPAENNVAVIFDGLDEIELGTQEPIRKSEPTQVTNKQLQRVFLKKELLSCWVVMASRQTKQLANQAVCDVRAEISGFDKARVLQYIPKKLRRNPEGATEEEQAKADAETKAETEKFLAEAKSSQLIQENNYGILTIPLLLNMTCTLFKERPSDGDTTYGLPRFRTGIYDAIVDHCWNREKTTGEEAVDSKSSTLVKLGELAWKGLHRSNKQLNFKTVCFPSHFQFWCWSRSFVGGPNTSFSLCLQEPESNLCLLWPIKVRGSEPNWSLSDAIFPFTVISCACAEAVWIHFGEEDWWKIIKFFLVFCTIISERSVGCSRSRGQKTGYPVCNQREIQGI